MHELKNKQMSTKFRDRSTNRFKVLQHVHNIQKQWKLFSKATEESTDAILRNRRGSNRENDFGQEQDMAANLQNKKGKAKVIRSEHVVVGGKQV